MKRIYAGNLSFSTTEENLENEFGKFGNVLSVRIIKDFNGASKGFGFIEMEDEDAEKAIKNMNGKILDGRKIRVSVAENREQKKRS